MHEPKQIVADGYDAIAETYRDWTEADSWPRLEWLALLEAELPGGSEVLELGCGAGVPVTRALAEQHRVTGVDISARQIELARENVPGATFVQGDALSLPFDAGAFDRVFTSYFYCHLEEGDRERFLAEARRVGSELVVVASIRREDDLPVRWDDRLLKDGSRWTVYKRVFEGADLAHELGGDILFKGRWFVVVRA